MLLSTAYRDVSTLNVGRRRRSACSLRPRDRLTILGVWGGYFVGILFFVLFNFVSSGLVVVWDRSVLLEAVPTGHCKSDFH